MTRSCIALTLFFLVLAGSLYAIRSAQGQTHLDARLGSARPGLCPLLGDEFHRCGFGTTAHPGEGPRVHATVPNLEVTEYLCPFALPEALENSFAQEEKGDETQGWHALADQGPGAEEDHRCCSGYSIPPADPYPLYSLLGAPVEAAATHARYLSGHDPHYDAVVYGHPFPPVPAVSLAEAVPADLVEACRQPLTYIFVIEDAPYEMNYGYQPGQLDATFGTRGAFRSLRAIPERWMRAISESRYLGSLECQLADVAYRLRRDVESSAWLALSAHSAPAQRATGRPMVTQRVFAEEPPRTEYGEPHQEAAGISTSGSERPLPHEEDGTRVLANSQRLLVKSLASSLDHTGRLLQNASRRLEGLLDNDTHQ
jgi:hypothetical protein